VTQILLFPFVCCNGRKIAFDPRIALSILVQLIFCTVSLSGAYLVTTHVAMERETEICITCGHSRSREDSRHVRSRSLSQISAQARFI
jgi:hypothetical protein